MGNGDGHSRFANPAGSHDADKPPGLDLRPQDFDDFVAADHPLQACGQGRVFGVPVRTTCRRTALLGAFYRCNEAIAPTRRVGDIARAVAAVAERSAKSGNMDPKTGLL